VRRLFQPNELPAVSLQPIQHGWQTAVYLNGHRVGTVTGNAVVESARTAGNHPPDAKTAAGSYDIGKIHPAPKCWAGKDQFSLGSQLLGRPMANVFEGCSGWRGHDPKHDMLAALAEARPGAFRAAAGCGLLSPSHHARSAHG
jgi:hypothetical protein